MKIEEIIEFVSRKIKVERIKLQEKQGSTFYLHTLQIIDYMILYQ